MGYSQFAPDGDSWAFHWGLHSLAWDWNRPSPLQPQRTTQICSIATSFPASTPLHFNSPGLHLSSCNSWEPPNPFCAHPTADTHPWAMAQPYKNHHKSSMELSSFERKNTKREKGMQDDKDDENWWLSDMSGFQRKTWIFSPTKYLKGAKGFSSLKACLIPVWEKKKKNKKILNTFSFSCRKHSCCTTETHILLMHFQHKTELGRMDFKSTKDSKIHTQAVLSTYTHAVIHREKPNTWIQPSSTARWGEASREGPELSCSGALPLQYHYSQLLSMACKFSAYSPS